MTKDEFRAMLVAITPNTFHYSATDQSDQYIVWAEYGERKLMANNRPVEKVIKIQVDLFTKTEDDPLEGQIRQALEDAEIVFEY